MVQSWVLCLIPEACWALSLHLHPTVQQQPAHLPAPTAQYLYEDQVPSVLVTTVYPSA